LPLNLEGVTARGGRLSHKGFGSQRQQILDSSGKQDICIVFYAECVAASFFGFKVTTPASDLVVFSARVKAARVRADRYLSEEMKDR